MKKVLAAVLFVAVSGLSGCGEPAGKDAGAGAAKGASNDAKASDAKASDAKAKAALTVTTVRLQEAQWAQGVAASGSISAWQETAVGSELGGLRLSQVLVNVGDVVKKGQLLASLSEASVEADLAQTRASLQEAQSAFAEAQANGDRARKFQGSGAISQQQITQYLTAEQTAKARIDVAKARLQSDELRMKQTRIVAPDDGVVSSRAATVGTVPGVGQELFRLILRGRLEWRAEVAAADIGRMKPGASASIILASGTKLTGKVRAIAPAVDPQTRNGLVYVDLHAEARSGEAKAGMFARGEIDIAQTEAQRRALTLPQSAVLLRDGFSYAFKVGADNKVAQVRVGAGRRLGDRIEVLSGLNAQDRVVESGVGFLADGDLVDVVAPAAQSAKAPATPIAAVKP